MFFILFANFYLLFYFLIFLFAFQVISFSLFDFLLARGFTLYSVPINNITASNIPNADDAPSTLTDSPKFLFAPSVKQAQREC